MSIVNARHYLEKAINLATRHHLGQVDLESEPYILHPLRVMFAVRTKYPQNYDAQTVAVLHDIIEDTTITVKDLRDSSFSDIIIEALVLLTHDKAVDYKEYIIKVSQNPTTKIVKIADLNDNLALNRMPYYNEKKDLSRIQKYIRAWMFLHGRFDEEFYRSHWSIDTLKAE